MKIIQHVQAIQADVILRVIYVNGQIMKIMILIGDEQQALWLNQIFYLNAIIPPTQV